MVEINFKKIEEKWQKKWEESKIFEVKEDSKKKKFYVLEMFPYPSGTGLHIGHAFNYTIGDIFARFKIMQGFNVLHPMGYDALGLPAENAAIKVGTHPEEYTKKSIANFMMQQKKLGLTYDWSRLVNTASPDYYKWDQWIFLKMFEKGLAYQKTSAVNWCPKCNTVLANEQVHNGKCEYHSDTEIEMKHLRQWFFKITDYAEELYEKIADLKNWPERTKAMQRNWIGKSHGTEIEFEINGEKWPVFTTRSDTIYGVTFMVVSAQHEKLAELVTKDKKKEVDKFLKKIGSVSQKSMSEVEDLDKEGVFTGSYAINPVTKDKIPVYAGNFVVADYGSGMVMAVPAHDQRDYLFAKKYSIPIKVVIQPEMYELNAEKMSRAFTGEGTLVNSGDFDGTKNKEAIAEITKFLEKKKIGKKVVQFKLRDWGISRQRYWGTPIPIIHCEKCGVVPVPEKDLPVVLPKEVKFGKGNPLETNEKWISVKCSKCGAKARRETDTMDTFVNSSWYFLRYCDSKNDKKIFDSKKTDYWCPVDQYIGGAEHACMHLIYIRFYTKFLRDLGLLEFDEPAINLFHQGMVNDPNGEKMSKSKGNVVEPIETINKYGVDATRFFLVSVASPDSGFNWSEAGIQGSLKFINKLFEYFEKVKIGKADAKTESKLNKIIKEVTNQIEEFKYNLAVIKIRELFSFLPQETSREILEKSLKLLSPFCPHIAEEFWEKIGGKGFISLSQWPKADEKKIDEKVEQAEQAVEKLVADILNVVKIVKEKGNREVKKVFIYVMPQEKKNFIENTEELKKRVGVEVEIFAVNDKAKYDPEEKSKKAKPGKPGIYLE